MSVSINTNSAATAAASNLASTNTMLQKSLTRLSSGLKIVSSSDDAGGLAVSMKMSAAIRRTDAANTNIANAQSFLQTQDGAFNTATKVLTRMSELSTLAQDVTKSSTDVAAYGLEFTALQGSLTALGGEQFNGVSMFAATAATLSVGTNESGSQTTTVTVAALTTQSAMAAAIAAGTLTSATAVATGTLVQNAIAALATMRAQNGSESSKLGFAQNTLTVNKQNLEAANSRIIDVDVASESTQLARFNILQQAGTAMLSQANQSSQSVLSLLR